MARWVKHFGLALASAFTIAGSAEAADPPLVPPNGDGIDTHLFRPAMDSKGFFYTNGADILGHLDISFGLIIDYGNNLLRTDKNQLYPDPATGMMVPATTGALINHSFQGTGQINLGLFNRLVVGLDVPVNLMAGDNQPGGSFGSMAQPGSPIGTQWQHVALDSQNLGFIGLHAKVRLTRVEKVIGLALAVQGGFTLTDAPRYGGADPTAFVWPMAIAEKRLGATGRLKLGLNAGFRIHPTSTSQFSFIRTSWVQSGAGGTPSVGKIGDGQRFTYGFGVSYRVAPPLDLVLDTYGAINTASGADFSLAMAHEVTAGLKLFVERNSYLMIAGGTRLGVGAEAADGRAMIGFIYEPSIGDRDGDGYKDDVDQCPDEPEDFDGFKDEDGCPDPDNDQDGILDVDDRCPNEPEDRDGDHDEDGCPEGNDGDRDGDGILDSKDKCPDNPEDRDGFQDSDGCPDPDNDQDGIPDKLDQCPNDPEDRDGFQDEDGCPDPDNDMDGIPDKADRCPGSDADVKANKDTKETFNGFEDDDGCPDKGNVIIQDNNLIILEKIKFKTNSAEILPESNKILDAVSTTLIHHPEFTLIEIAGHADERAPDDYNLRLTQDRVNSVMAALAARGVARDHLRSKGYGEYCPEDPAHNDAAWEKNRRVEFKIVKTKDGPTGVELGCQNARTHGVPPEPVPP